VYRGCEVEAVPTINKKSMVNNLNAPPIKSVKPDIIGKNGWLVKKLERKDTTYILRSRVRSETLKHGV